jgi:hypothetical protein
MHTVTLPDTRNYTYQIATDGKVDLLKDIRDEEVSFLFTDYTYLVIWKIDISSFPAYRITEHEKKGTVPRTLWAQLCNARRERKFISCVLGESRGTLFPKSFKYFEDSVTFTEESNLQNFERMESHGYELVQHHKYVMIKGDSFKTVIDDNRDLAGTWAKLKPWLTLNQGRTLSLGHGEPNITNLRPAPELDERFAVDKDTPAGAIQYLYNRQMDPTQDITIKVKEFLENEGTCYGLDGGMLILHHKKSGAKVSLVPVRQSPNSKLSATWVHVMWGSNYTALASVSQEVAKAFLGHNPKYFGSL